jgi:hemolysin III
LIEPPVAVKPRLRGVWHTWACIVSVPLGVTLVLAATSTRARVALAVYAVSLISLFGVSAVYHRVNWRTLGARRWMRRLDHSMIFMLIAGTYTPFAVLVLHGRLALAILIAVWALAALGTSFNLVWITAPKWLLTIVYMLFGWAAIVTIPQLAASIGATGLGLLVVSGLCYTGGAVIYAVKRPNPIPGVFGYHELFHALVVVAAAFQYAVIAVWVLPG